MRNNSKTISFFKASKKWPVPKWFNWIIAAALVTFSAYFLTPPPVPSLSSLKVGDKVWTEIKSSTDFTIVDESTTENRRHAAENAVLPVYDFDSRLYVQTLQKLTRIFTQFRQRQREERLREGLQDTTLTDSEQTIDISAVPTVSDSYPRSLFTEFIDESGLKISSETFEVLASLKFSVDIERGVKQILDRIRDYIIVANRNLLLQQDSIGITRKDLANGEEKSIYNLGLILSIEEAWRDIDLFAAQIFPENQIFQDISAELARAAVRPNLTLNMQETQNRKQRAREAIKPVIFKVNKGEIIARTGDRVTPEVKMRLDHLNRFSADQQIAFVFIGNLILCSGLLVIAYLFFCRFERNLMDDRERSWLVVLISVIQLILNKGFILLAGLMPGFMSQYPYDLVEPYRYAIPFAVGPILLALLVNSRVAIVFSFLYGVLASVAADQDFLIGVYAMIGGCTAVYVISQYKQRTMVLGAGFMVSLGNLFTVTTLFLLSGRPPVLMLALSSLTALANGLISAALVTILLPVLESIFRIPTDIRLLELSSFNEPLLRKLAIEAPGTHHHSLIVGDLAGIAAEAIGANALLARVGAYYHDIGKTSKPAYYIENVKGKNPHDELAPNMSAMIIRKHVKDGVELARKAGLSKDMINIIEQHHGTSLMTMFFEKARNQALKEGRQVMEDEFRYPGPRPKSREAAIVMLADSVEAAVRSLKSASPAALKGMVHKITSAKFQDRQFDDCDLTFRELTIISDQLYERLLRNYHSRLKYPGFDFEASDEEDLIRVDSDYRQKEGY